MVAGRGAGHFVLKLWGSVLVESGLFQAALKRGSAHAWSGRWEQAVQEYRLAVRQSPMDPSAKTYLAMALFKSGELEEALDLYQELWKSQPSNLAILHRLAEVQEALDDLPSALASYRLLAEIHGRRHEPSEALKVWRKAVDLNPADLQLWDSLMASAAQAGAVADCMPGYLGLAREFAMGGRFQDAIQVVDRAQKLDPANPAIPVLLSAIRKALEFSWRVTAAGDSIPKEALARWFAANMIVSTQRPAEETPPLVEEPRQTVETAEPCVPVMEWEPLASAHRQSPVQGLSVEREPEVASAATTELASPPAETEPSPTGSVGEVPGPAPFPLESAQPADAPSVEDVATWPETTDDVGAWPETTEDVGAWPEAAVSEYLSAASDAYSEVSEAEPGAQIQEGEALAEPQTEMVAEVADPGLVAMEMHAALDPELTPEPEVQPEPIPEPEVQPEPIPELEVRPSPVPEPEPEAQIATAGELLELAVVARGEERSDDALDLLQQALDLGTPSAEVLLELASLQERMGLWEEAIASYGQALELDPGLVEALLGRARMLMRAGRRDEAEGQYRELLNDPSADDVGATREAVAALVEIARENASQGEIAAAAERLVWLRSKVAQPQLPPSMAERAATASAELFGRCGGEHLEEIALLPVELQDGVARELKRAEDLAARGNLRSAADCMYELIAECPDFLPAQSLLGRVLAAQGRQAEARDRSDRLAVLYDMRGSPHRLLELLWWQAADGVGDEDGRARLADALRAENRLAEAEAVLAGRWPERWGAGQVESAPGATALPGPVEDLLRRAEASFVGGDPAEATRLLRSALEDGDRLDPPVKAALLRVLQLMGDAPVGGKCLRAVLREMGLPEGLAEGYSKA